MDRRMFLKYSAAAAAGAAALGVLPSATAQEPTRIYRALKIGMLPSDLSDKDKFALAKRAGFEGIDGSPIEDLDAAREQAQWAKEAGVPLHGLVFGGWHAPFSSPDPAVIKKGMDGMEVALRHANAIGATTVLLVPAVVDENVSYADAYTRSQQHIRELIPLAAEMKVVIGIENVWNKFLLSPLEFARYLDEFDSPWVKAYFDIGNVIIYGYSQHWIRILDKRIVKLDVKDFKREGYEWKNLLEGDVNWREVRKALTEIGYSGFMTAEVDGGDEAYLTDLAQRMERINAGDV
ncbi:MAG TPA: sugar phosphate isomerase/epimerase family protein [Candidatus Hydrogenedentes bacterium]|nr:sugar phosphate isomerase/epimerase family protein [Candidatus Hydrogenedentota bacterium]HPG68793.1 sugar phosphate isomerase/epimerase family protein [Candidatus Hydrogenedentota bacterium]